MDNGEQHRNGAARFSLGTSKNSSHEESAESFPYARVAGSSQKTFAEDKLCARIFVASDEKSSRLRARSALSAR